MRRRARCGSDAGSWSTVRVLTEIHSRATGDRTTVHTMSSRNDAGCVSRETGPAFPRLHSSANPLCAADGENNRRTNAAFCNCTPSRSTHFDQHIRTVPNPDFTFHVKHKAPCSSSGRYRPGCRPPVSSGTTGTEDVTVGRPDRPAHHRSAHCAENSRRALPSDMALNL